MTKPQFSIPYLVIYENHNPVHITDDALSTDLGLVMKTIMVKRGPHQMYALIDILFYGMAVNTPFDFLTKTQYLPECKMTPFHYLEFFGMYLHVTCITL